MATKERMFTTERKNWRVYGGVLAATGALALAGCGGSESEPKATATTTQAPAPSETQTSTSSAPTKEMPTLVFDDLGGGSSIIRVYAGVKQAAADKETTGTFNSGDSVPAECKTEGRTIHSDTSAGEADRTSSDWIRIHGTPGETQYATAVYVENPKDLLAQLPEC